MHTTIPSRLAAALALASVLGGCTVEAFTYTIDRYGTVKATHVHLGCRDTYEVFDRPADGTLLVTSGPVNEAVADLCDGGVARLSTPQRLRRAAEIFLAETTLRPDCRIAGERPVSGNHVEFTYRCPTVAGRSARR